MTNNTVAYPWEATVENPSMVAAGGGFYLAFSAGIYQSASVLGGDHRVHRAPRPLWVDEPDPDHLRIGELGPGGGALFPDARATGGWTTRPGRVARRAAPNYGCGAARQLFVAPIALPNVNGSGPLHRPRRGPQGYAGGLRTAGCSTTATCPICGSEGGRYLNRPVVGMARPPTMAVGTGWWPATAGSSPTATPAFYGSTGGTGPEQAHRRAWRPPRTAVATGWWPRTAGVFTFGDADFYGSTGGIALNRPIVGMAATPDGGGYWLVAATAGVFSYGDAVFHGSTGGMPLNRPVVGMAGLPERRRLLAGGQRRRDLLLRRRGLLRLDRRHRPQPARGGHGGQPRRRRVLAGGQRRRASSTTATPLRRLRREPSAERPGRRDDHASVVGMTAPGG